MERLDAKLADHLQYSGQSNPFFSLPYLPDDMHHHLRDGENMESVLQHIDSRFGYIVVMPNLIPPVTTVAQAIEYKTRIDNSAIKQNLTNMPTLMMTLYLTDKTTIDDINDIVTYNKHNTKVVYAIKLYPQGATTNSAKGVSNIEHLLPVLHSMSLASLPLLIHGESTNVTVDIFDKEAIFLKESLIPLLLACPDLNVVLEHITTLQSVNFIRQVNNGVDNDGAILDASCQYDLETMRLLRQRKGKVAGTITAHHMLYNRNALFKGGICPHMYCLPILKREQHRLALISAATSGERYFFAGSDSAPHTIESKESVCGCAGVFTAHAITELYTEIFANENKLHMLCKFLCLNGKYFYDIKIPDCQLDDEGGELAQVSLIKQSWVVPDAYKFGSTYVKPLRAGENIHWSRCL